MKLSRHHLLRASRQTHKTIFSPTIAKTKSIFAARTFRPITHVRHRSERRKWMINFCRTHSELLLLSCSSRNHVSRRSFFLLHRHCCAFAEIYLQLFRTPRQREQMQIAHLWGKFNFHPLYDFRVECVYAVWHKPSEMFQILLAPFFPRSRSWKIYDLFETLFQRNRISSRQIEAKWKFLSAISSSPQRQCRKTKAGKSIKNLLSLWFMRDASTLVFLLASED